MLAVIQNDEGASGLEVAHERVDEGTTWRLLDPQDGGDGLEDQSGVGKRGKLHEPPPVVSPDGPGCHCEGEAGFAGASGVRKGEQAVLGEQRLDLGYLPFAPDKAGQLQRQIVAGAPGSLHRLQVFLPILGWVWRILHLRNPRLLVRNVCGATGGRLPGPHPVLDPSITIAYLPRYFAVAGVSSPPAAL